METLKRTNLLLMILLLLPFGSGCSKSPREEYAQELITGIDEVYAALEQYRSNPSGTGKSTDPVNMTVNGKSVRVDGANAMLVSQSYVEIAASKAKAFSDKFQTVSFQKFMDIRSDDGYEEWAEETDRKLRETADKCLAIIARIKSEYKVNPDADAFNSTFIGRPYRVISKTPDDELVFATDMQKGIIIERILKMDFRKIFDGIHRGEVESGGK
jgi:hypothetical protein